MDLGIQLASCLKRCRSICLNDKRLKSPVFLWDHSIELKISFKRLMTKKIQDRNVRNFCSLCNVYIIMAVIQRLKKLCILILISFWKIHFLDKQDVFKEENLLVSNTHFPKTQFLTDFIILVHSLQIVISFHNNRTQETVHEQCAWNSKPGGSLSP